MRALAGLVSKLVLAGIAAISLQAVGAQSVYEKDMAHALDALEEKCGQFFELKKIDWDAVRTEFTASAKEIESDADHWVLLTRLLARLRDGHAYAQQRESTKGVKWPDMEEKTGPGMFWCVVGSKVFVKNSWGAARGEGIEPGMEIVAVNGEPVIDWLKGRMMELEDTMSFSTAHQKLFYALHWGLKDSVGAEMELSVLKPGRRTASRKKIVYMARTSYLTDGPAYLPEGLKIEKNVKYGKTPDGFGYIHIRRCKAELNDEIDRALAAVGKVPGMIIDFRGNSGGGFDHDAFMGRFLPEGKEFTHGKKYVSAGAAPYGGPLVVIGDATVRSTGETAIGTLKEDGRAYMIGESPTAGMSASKTTIELPSGKFGLYVSVHSNKARFQDGRGIEGVGIEPHEKVAFDPEDLEKGVDTMIKIGEERLKEFPQEKVPYDPGEMGWMP